MHNNLNTIFYHINLLNNNGLIYHLHNIHDLHDPYDLHDLLELNISDRTALREYFASKIIYKK